MNNRETHSERNVLSAAQRQKQLMFGLIETIGQLAMASSVHWYSHVLRRENGHVMRRALDFEIKGQRRKGRLKRTWKKQIKEESVKAGLRRGDALCRSRWGVDTNQIDVGLR